MPDSTPAVFLSYASQDAEAAERIADALRTAGIEVWFDKSELVGGDAWDAKIRRQIQACSLFVPLISANTESRPEGYFRLEWKLAVDRTHLMADDHPFLFPVVIDDTSDAQARVPARFRERQWMRLDVTAPEKIAQRLVEMLNGESSAEAPSRGSSTASGGHTPIAAKPAQNQRRLIRIPASLLILVGAIWLIIDRHSDAPSVDDPTAFEAVSEVERMLQQADELIMANTLSRSDLATAIELCEEAAEREPLNPAVWAVWSRACSEQVFYRFDNSAPNKTRAQDYAAKALSLDPESREARFAQIIYWTTVLENLALSDPALYQEALADLRALHEEAPNDPRYQLYLGGMLTFFPESKATGLAMLSQLAERPEWKERAWNSLGFGYLFRGEFALAQEAANQGLTENNHPPILVLNAMLQMYWQGDLDAALEFLNRLPPGTQREDWLLALRIRLLLWRNEPQPIISLLNQHPREWIDSQIFDCPKAWLSGEANRMMGRELAAQQDYARALQLIDNRMTRDSKDGNLLSLKVWILKRMDRTDEAREVYDLMVDNNWSWFGVNTWFDPAAVVSEIEAIWEHPDLWRTAASLRYVEWFEPIREKPPFQALLARAETSAKHTPHPKQPFPADAQLSQAYGLVNSLEANPEDFLLAEDIVKSVLADRPLDPEVIITMAWVQQAFVFRGFDRSPERIALARRYAERAERLAPEDPHALLAYGVYQMSVIRDIPLAEQTLRRAVTLNPQDSMTQRFLDEACWRQTKYSAAEILAMVEETAARFPDDALNHYAVARVYRNLGQPAEMEAALDRTLAIYPLANAILYKARLAMIVRGDLAEMGRLLEQVPDRMRNTERVVVTRFQHALFSEDYDAGLAALQRFTAPWIEDNDYVGPKALMEAILLESAGRNDVARRMAATAAEVMRQESSINLMRQTRRDSFIDIWVYWHSGEKDAALESLTTALQATDRPYRPFPLNAPWDSLLAASLVMGQQETALELMSEAVAPPNLVEGDHPWVLQSGDAYSSNMRDTLANWLKLDPRMKPWREDPDVLSLLSVTETAATP